MEDSKDYLKKPTTWEEPERKILETFEKINLAGSMPPGTYQRIIAILGAGAVVEAKPLTNYFINHGFGKPMIIAFDLDEKMKLLTEGLINSGYVDIEYRIEDVADPESFKNEEYDLVIIRRPAVHTSQVVWERAFQNGFEHLRPGGIFLTTTDLYDDFVIKQLKREGRDIKKYMIPKEDSVPPYFNEFVLYTATKG